MNEDKDKDKVNPVVEEWETLSTHDVAKLFKEFVSGYDYWRNLNGLSGSIDNIHEVLTAMSDKHGRICRQIKHFERNDAKDNWPEGMTEAIVGYLIYALMILKKYDVDILTGMKNELQTAVDQHGNKTDIEKAVKESVEETISDAPIIKLVSLMIRDAIKEDANQIRFHKDSQGFMVEYRKDNELVKYENIPVRLQSAILARIYIMAGMVLENKKEHNKGAIEVIIYDDAYKVMVESFPSDEENNPIINMKIEKGTK